MTHYVSTSGGLGSTVSCLIAHREGLDFEMLFADTMIEDEDLYKLLDDLERAVGKRIVRLVDGRDPWQVFEDQQFIGNSRIAPCSKILKTRQVKTYLDEHAAPDDPLVLGMDMSEQDRLDRSSLVWAPRPVVSLINEYKVWRPQWPEILADYGLDRLPRLYEQGFPHNNCGGFCVRGGQRQFVTLLETNRERYLWHERREQEAMSRIRGARPFLHRTVRGERVYMTLREFRELYEAGQITVGPYDFGGCGCFVDD